MWWEFAKERLLQQADQVVRFGGRDQATAIREAVAFIEACRTEFKSQTVERHLAAQITGRSAEHLERMVRDGVLEDCRMGGRESHRFRLGNLMDHFACKWPASRIGAKTLQSLTEINSPPNAQVAA